jgi:hypothetical protein
MSAIKQLLKQGMKTLASAWGTDEVIIGSVSRRAIWNDSLDTATLQEGGFDPADVASILLRSEDIPTGTRRGWQVEARGKKWRIHEIRGRSDVATTLVLIDQRASK